MNINRKIYFYRGILPFYLVPIILFLGLIVLSVFVILGLFIGTVVGIIAIGLMLFRLLIPSKKKETKPMAEDGRTIILREDEYEVIEKK